MRENAERRFGKNLLLRVVMAVIFVPLFLFVSYKGGIPFFLYVELLILVGMGEYFNMVKSCGHKTYRKTGTLFALALGAIFFYAPGESAEMLVFLLFCLLLLLLILWLLSRDPKGSLEGVGLSLLGVFYIGFLFSHQILIREIPSITGGSEMSGWHYLLFPYFIVWTSDTSAYFVGKFFGKHRLAPVTSPGKTVEGAIGGIVCSIILALIYHSFVPEHIFLKDALILGLLVAIVCQLGDMIESRIKRETGVKDSSSFIPGHGGVLDRYDGILVSVPVAYYYFIWIAPLV
jgi:phosphatidate cytidylyltransferase